MNTLNNEAVGIFQGDVILRTALVEAIRDLRVNPFLLYYVFRSLAQDALTCDEYGQREVERAKEWFQKTEIRVVNNLSLNAPSFPCLTIEMISSQEVEAEGTLGDTHYVPFEDNNWSWPVLAGPLTPTSYVQATGAFTVDPAALNGYVVVPGMVVVARSGAQYPIVDVGEAPGTFSIAPAADDFRGMVVKPADPAYFTEVESTVFRESYAVGCHVDGEPVHLVYLHSVAVFILRRYNQALLEARGFERSTISSTDFKRQGEDLPEFVYSRYVQVTGSVREAWPKTIAMKPTTTAFAAQESQVGQTPVLAPPGDDLESILDSDPLDLIGG